MSLFLNDKKATCSLLTRKRACPEKRAYGHPVLIYLHQQNMSAELNKVPLDGKVQVEVNHKSSKNDPAISFWSIV